jgi:hypothetical protein
MHPRGKLNFQHICCSCTLAVEVSRKEVIKPLYQQWLATRQKTACPIPFGCITHPSSCHSTYKTNTSTTTGNIMLCTAMLLNSDLQLLSTTNMAAISGKAQAAERQREAWAWAPAGRRAGAAVQRTKRTTVGYIVDACRIPIYVYCLNFDTEYARNNIVPTLNSASFKCHHVLLITASPYQY